MSVPAEVMESFPLLMKWASLIHSSAGCNLDIPSLKSGRIFAEILHLSDDEYFTEDWLESIHSFDNSVNTRIIRHNMGKVEAMVKNYYAEKARRKLMGNELWSIADNIADDSDESTQQAIVAMACLVVSAPFLCSNANKEHMERLQNQTEEVQMAMVNAMQLITINAPELEEGETITLISSHSRGSASALSATDDENPEQMQAMLKAKFDEVAKLTKEKERLEKELELFKKRSGNDSTTENMEKEIRILKSSKLKLEEHAIELESERDVCKQKLEELMCKNEELEKKALSILSMEEELRRLRDEVEELRAKRMQMDDLSLAHEQLKNRNNEMKHLQQENQLLRNKVESYVRQIAELEEAKNNRKQLHSQLGAYKAKAEEKERDAEGLMRKVDMLAHELVVAQERISQLEVENRRLLDAKQEMETRLRLDGVLSQSGNESGVMEHSLHEDMKLSLGEANSNERIRELEAEKEQLLERVRTAESKIAQLESELKVETKKKADAKKMLDDLENYGQDDEEKKKDTVDLRLQIEKQNIEIDHLRKLYESAEKKATEADEAKLKAVEELENQKKTNTTMEEQHKVYMEKAKLIIVDQDRRMTATSETGFSHAEFDSMRRTIEQKDKQIRRLEERLTEMCNMHEQEQRLVTTQYYQMIQKVEQADRRSGSMEQNGGPKTFLSQQKQSTAFTARSLRGPAATILTVFICYVLYYFIEYINDPDVFY